MSSAAQVKKTNGDHRTVLPEKIIGEAGEFLKKALAVKPLAQNFEWVFDRYEKGGDFVALVAQFLDRYEMRLTELAGERLDGAAPALRAGLTYRMLYAMRPYRMRMANCAINPLFVETYLKKRLLADVMGIKMADVERRIQRTARKPIDYLNEELHILLPKTFLAHF